MARPSFFRRRSIKAPAIALCLILLPVIAYGANRSLLHATLLRSTPAANSRISRPPATIRLVFSEQVVPELSQISLIAPDGKASPLKVTNDPHDVHTLLGSVGAISSGNYKVLWRVLSADGHPVAGAFSFVIASEDVTNSPGAVAGASSTVTSAHDSGAHDTLMSSGTPMSPEVTSVPVLASLLRGVGLGAMMAGLGLLFFGVTAGERRSFAPRKVVIRLVVIGAGLLIAHLIAWMYDISPTGSLGGYFSISVLGSTPGKIESARVALALLAVWAILMRWETVALVFGGACLLVSGAIGHPAAIHPYWTIPAKMVHLLAGSLWLGGLLWLVSIARQSETAFPIEAKRVSSAALLGVIAIFFSGTIQARFFLNTPGDLIHSGYGRLALVKMIGLVVLVGFGAYNRFGVLPQIDSSHSRPKLVRSVRQEIAIVIVLILIGGFLAYVPTPPTPQSSLSVFTGRPQ
jgi:copper transport protein